MLKPRVEVAVENGVMAAEFWDCLRLDPAPVKDLRSKFEDHLKVNGSPVLIVDLNGVGFAGSSALGGFLTLHRLAKGAGGRLIFCNVDPNVLEVFRVSKLDPFFAFVADLPAARQLAESNEPKNEPAQPTDSAPKDLNASLRRGRRKPSS